MRRQSKVVIVAGLIIVSSIVGLLAVSWNRKRSPWLEAQRRPGSLPEASLSSADRARLLGTAREAAKLIAIPDDSEPFIQETDTEYIVTFPVWYSRIGPGADFYAQIVINKASGEVVRELIGS